MLRPRSRFFAVPQTEGKLVGKTWFGFMFFFLLKRRFFFLPKKEKKRLTKKTHKKCSISFVVLCAAPVWKENKYWGSLNLWTIYILCVIFFFFPLLSRWRSFAFVRCCMMILLSWFLFVDGFQSLSLILHSCNWFLTFFFIFFFFLIFCLLALCCLRFQNDFVRFQVGDLYESSPRCFQCVFPLIAFRLIARKSFKYLSSKNYSIK